MRFLRKAGHKLLIRPPSSLLVRKSEGVAILTGSLVCLCVCVYKGISMCVYVEYINIRVCPSRAGYEWQGLVM